MTAGRDLHHPIHELLAARWSPYGFSERAVSGDELCSLFEAARWAPSGSNEQPWRFIVATRDDPALFERVLSCLVEGNRTWARRAPVLMLTVASMHMQRSGSPNRTAWYDIGLAIANLSVEATARGLAVHQMGGILPERAREEFSVPEGYEVVTAVAVGYGDRNADLPERLLTRDEARRPRKPLSDFVFGGTWGTTAGWVAGD